MSGQDLKALALEVWRYFAAHPEARRKSDLPEALLSQIRGMAFSCPLCEFFLQGGGLFFSCDRCPLGSCASDGSLFLDWAHSLDPEKRCRYAQRIADAIGAWDPGRS